MKAGEIRDMSREETRRKNIDMEEEMFNLRFQHGIGQLENPQRMKQLRRDIAKVKTILREKELESR